MQNTPEILRADPVDPPPSWLDARRQTATEQVTTFPHPTGREEAWRYTDVSLLRAELFASLTDPSQRLPESARAHWRRWNDEPAQATLVDGHPVVTILGAEAARAGASLVSLSRANPAQRELLRTSLGTLIGAEDLFTAQSLASFGDALLLHVPRGARLAEPLRLQHWIGAAGARVQPRLVVVVEPDAEVTLIDDLAGDDLATPTLVVPVTELLVGAGARVTWQSWQGLGRSTRHLAHVAARLERDAELTTFCGTFGADLSRTALSVEHAGEGARSTLLSAYFPTGSQHMEHWTVQDLRAPHSASQLLYKGVLAGEGHSLYYGTIAVGPDARGTDSHQTNRNLLLSDKARADSNPQLEIDTHDVRCSHGSSVGQVEAEQLFYAMARGIPRAEAERMLVIGFLAEVAGRLAGEEARDRLERWVRQTLRSNK